MTKKNKMYVLRFFQLFFLGLMLSTSCKIAFADTYDPEQIKALIEETRALRLEVNQLKRQLVTQTNQHSKGIVNKERSKAFDQQQAKNTYKKNSTATRNKKNQITTSKKRKKEKTKSLIPAKQKVQTLGGFIPIIAPYLGQPSAYDGSDLLTNLSQQNASLLVLQYREQLKNAFSAENIANVYLLLSGSLDAQINLTSPYIGPKTNDIDLTVANITALAGIGKWVTGFFSFDYDSLPLSGLNPPQYGPRVGNSRIYLDQGFITIGNLKEFHFYGSIGQMYLPFGQYNSFMVNSPLTASLFTTSQRPALLGYNHTFNDMELNASIYTFQGDTQTTKRTTVINAWGANIDYLIKKTNWNSEFSLAYISNIANSEGILLNGQTSQLCTLFAGFAFPCNNGNILIHSVPGFNAYGSVTVNSLTILGEYLTATRAFSPFNMTYNHRGAKPQAYDLEAAYAFNLFSKPSTLAIGLAATKDALALLLPAKEYSITFTTSLWRHTTESLGFQHDINYGAFSTGSGQGLPIYLPANRSNLGKTSNTLVLAVNAFF